MKTILPILLTLLSFHSCGSTKEANRPEKQAATPTSPSTLIIYYDVETDKAPLEEAVKSYKAEIIYNYDSFHAIAIRIPKSKLLSEAKAHFEQVKGVLQVQEDHINQLH